MTIASQTSRISYVGDGVTTAFPVPFLFSTNADIKVMLQSSLGIQTTLVLGTNYNLTGAGVSAGGTCTFTAAPTATTGAVIAIFRDPPVTQTASYNNNDPFPAKSHEGALDKLTTLEQRTRDLVTRSLQLPDSDPVIDMHLPTVAIRKNKLAGFDGTGLPVAVLGPSFVGGTDIGAAVVSTRAVASVTTFAGSVIYLQTGGYSTVGDGGGARYQRGTGAGSFTDGGAVSWIPIFDGNLLNASVFGVKGDGVTDDTTALQAAVTAASGKVLLIKGICGVSAKVNVSDNTTIIGNNNKLDGFKVLGSNSLGQGILYANNKTNIKVRNLRFTGNLIEPAPFSSGAMRFELDTLAAADMFGLEVSSCFFENFRTTEWIWFVVDANSTWNMREIKVFNNEVYAVAGCATTNAISGVSGNTFVRVSGNTLGTIGSEQSGSNIGAVSNILFTNNSCVGFGLSGMFQAFANTREMVVNGNVTRSMGNNTLAVDRVYTYLFYNSSTGVYPDPTNIVCNDNVGYGNHSNAIYFAGCCNFAAVGNSFGFTYPSGLEPGLAHGSAISINGGIDGVVVGNTLTDGLGGISYIGVADRASTVTIAGNTIRSSTNSSGTQVAYGILLTGSVNNVASITNIVGNSITLTGTTASGISIVGGAGVNYSRLNIADNVISATQFGVNCTGTLPATTTLRLSGNQYSGTMSLYGVNLDSSGTVFITDEIIDCVSQVAGGANGVRVSGNNYVIDGITIANGAASATGFSASTAQGTLRNITFPNWAGTQVLAGSMGLGIPSWSAKIGATVENLSKSILGSGGYATTNQQYVINHWINVSGSTTWLAQRQLTGT